METETHDKFAELAEKICDRVFSGSLPDAPEEIVSALLTHILPALPDFQHADDEIAKRALENFAGRVVLALRAHTIVESTQYEN